MTTEIKQSTTTYPLCFLMVDSTDHVTGKTGLTPTVTLSKAGAAFGAAAGAVTEIGSGWYKVAGNATDSNTLGPLLLHATGTAADPSDKEYNVTARLADDLAYPATTGRSLAVDASGRILSDLDTIKTQTVTCAAGVTVPTSIASPTNITAATGIVLSGVTHTGAVIPTVTTVTNQLTAAQIATGVWQDTTAGDFTVALSVGKSVMNGVALGTGLTVASVSGAVGSVSGAVGSVTGAVGSVTGNVGGNVVGSVASVTAGVTVTTNNDKSGYELGVGGSASFTESYRADGATGTLPQLLYEIVSHLGESTIAATTKTIKKIDGATTAATFTLNDATTPTSITRTT
jgi:hypothetical protein